MLRRILLSFIIVILSTCLALAQGSISGAIKDAKTGEAIIGANVLIVETSTGAATDVTGEFTIAQIAAGTYSLKVSSITYKTHSVPNVVVEDGKKVTLDILLSEDVSELQEIVIQAKRHTDTDFELLRSIKEAKLVVSGITAEQISRSLDRDAAQVLRRVPGITIKDNQFVQIRGLSERYNVVMLHNTYAPSVETDVRSFSFATLPSSQLDRILVFKSASADLPGDFAGGIVKVFTKSIPDENSVVLDYSTQVRAGTTFQTYYHQQKDPQQFTGFNNNYYDLPSNFPKKLNGSSEAASNAAGSVLKNTWTEQKGSAIPDQRFTLTLNRKFYIGKAEIGNISAVNYSNSYTSFNIDRGEYTISNGAAARTSQFNDKQYSQIIRTGFLFNWAIKLNANNRIDFKNIYNLGSNDQFVSRNGTRTGASFNKIYSSIYSSQLLGSHDLFNKKTTVDWVAGYNKSARQQPDYKRYFVNLDESSGRSQINVPNTADPNNLGRFYSSLNEETYSGGISIKQRFGFKKDPLKSPELKAGVFFENKKRNFAARNIGYTWSSTPNQTLADLPVGKFFEPQNLNSTGIRLAEDSKRKDSYSANNNLLAYYLMTSIPFTSKIKIDGGVRVEDNLQQLHSFDDFNNKPIEPSLHVVSILPSANASYNFTEKMLVRAAYGQTVNRPEFRELSKFGFYDFNFNFLYIGNPDLKTATIQNFDLRWELYPSKTEMLTFGAFYKNFKNPIELHNDGNGGGLQEIDYENAKSAMSYGLELEIKKSLRGLTSLKLVDNLNFLFNASVIKSTVIQQDNALAVYQEKDRPMQGQAPYVINSGIFYASERSGWQVNLLYNVVGKNIFVVGNQISPSVYIMPRNVVDLVFTKQLTNHLQIKGGISDLFNQPMLLMQDANGDGKLDRSKDSVVQKFKPGQVFSLGFSWKIM